MWLQQMCCFWNATSLFTLIKTLGKKIKFNSDRLESFLSSSQCEPAGATWHSSNKPPPPPPLWLKRGLANTYSLIWYVLDKIDRENWTAALNEMLIRTLERESALWLGYVASKTSSKLCPLCQFKVKSKCVWLQRNLKCDCGCTILLLCFCNLHLSLCLSVPCCICSIEGRESSGIP